VAIFGASKVRESFVLTAAALDAQAPDMAAASRSITLADFVTGEGYVSREVALSVPAYRRARTLVAQTLAGCVLKVRESDGTLHDPTYPFLQQPDPGRPSVALWADLVGDLCDYGVAFAIKSQDSNGQLVGITRVDPENVTTTADGYEITTSATDVWGRMVGTAEVRRYSPRQILAFESDAGNWLRYGSRAINTARLLEDAARTYASAPSPTTVLSNTGPRKTPEQVVELLDAFEAARRTRSTAYTGRDITLESFGFDATQIALSDARGTAVLDIARVTGVPSLYLGQGANDASMTYSNMTQQRLDLLNAIQPFATAIEQRLSWNDVSTDGTTVRWDFSAWLRTDPKLRAEIAAIYVPLGVLTVDEVRAYEDLAPSNAAPAGRAPNAN
jgi:HK97 family phage portal protein